MDWQRTFLIGAIAVVSVLLINEWGDFQERNRPEVSQETIASSNSTGTTTVSGAATTGDMPQTPTADEQASDIPTAVTKAAAVADAPVTPTHSQLVSVTTDKLEVLIDTHGGDIVKVALRDQLAKLGSKDPFILLNRTQSTIYIAQSGLIGKDGTDTAKGRPTFTAEQTSYTLGKEADSLNVDLQLPARNGVTITKRFHFTRGEHLMKVEYLINNQSSQAWQAGLFGQIKRDDHNPVKVDGFGMQPFLGAALTTPDEHYYKMSFADIADDGGFKTSITGGWVAMVQHYFLSAWIPNQEQDNHYSLREGKGDIFLMGFTSPIQTVASGSSAVISAEFYAGPKDVNRLEEISPYLDLTVDYGWLWWIAKPLFFILQFIHGILGSWGWSIVVLTLLIKLAFFKLSATSYRSMANMRKFGPEMARLKEQYGDDRERMSKEMMKLYKKEKINPLSGCLPILVQMPVFISLYWVLMESVELRHTSFFWIQDLSVKDPYFILPVLMGLTMFVQQRLNPTPPDPTQAKIMQMMPFVFTFMFLWFPAGLVLYWVVNNSLSIAQQWYITRSIEQAEAAKS